MNATLKGAEIDCVKALAKAFEEGKLQWSDDGDLSPLGLTEENFARVMKMMELCGAITEVVHTHDGDFSFFNISPRAVLLARQIEEQEAKSQERKDIVEIVKLTLKKHPLPAWSFLIFTAITFLAVGVHNIIAVLKDFGVIGP